MHASSLYSPHCQGPPGDFYKDRARFDDRPRSSRLQRPTGRQHHVGDEKAHRQGDGHDDHVEGSVHRRHRLAAQQPRHAPEADAARDQEEHARHHRHQRARRVDLPGSQGTQADVQARQLAEIDTPRLHPHETAALLSQGPERRRDRGGQAEELRLQPHRLRHRAEHGFQTVGRGAIPVQGAPDLQHQSLGRWAIVLCVHGLHLGPRRSRAPPAGASGT